MADAAHAVVQEAMDAGVWVFGGGMQDQKDEDPVMWAVTERSPTARTLRPRRSSADSPSSTCPLPEGALEWAAKIAVACRCAQEIREFIPDPAVGN